MTETTKGEKRPCSGCLDPEAYPIRPASLDEQRTGPAPERFEPRWRRGPDPDAEE